MQSRLLAKDQLEQGEADGRDRASLDSTSHDSTSHESMSRESMSRESMSLDSMSLDSMSHRGATGDVGVVEPENGESRRDRRESPTGDRRRGGPLPRQPKGQRLTGCVLIAVVGLAGYMFWNSFLRFSAHGHVQGRILNVGSVLSGSVQSLHVRGGDVVRQGDVLAVLETLDEKQTIGALEDQLRVARAELQADAATLALQAQVRRDDQQLAVAEFYQAKAEYAAEKARLAYLRGKRDQYAQLALQKAISGEELERVGYDERAQAARLEKLQKSVAALSTRGTPSLGEDRDVAGPLRLRLTKIEQLQAELRRQQDRLGRRVVRAPCAGRVLNVWKFPGEYADRGEPLVEVLAEDSLQVVVYLPQHRLGKLAVGHDLPVRVESAGPTFRCQVVRIGSQLVDAPRSLEKNYRHGQKLLPVFLRPPQRLPGDVELRVDSRVVVPSIWDRGHHQRR